MSVNYKTPGVYIEEISNFPPSVVAVETAIPAFIGYTEKIDYTGESLLNKPVEISSLLDYENIFGLAPSIGAFSVTVDADGNVNGDIADPNEAATARYRMANALKHFYRNGGGRCYIISMGDYSASIINSDIAAAHLLALDVLSKEDEPTLIVFPDLSGMVATLVGDATADAIAIANVRASYHGVLIQALNQCAALGDRFLIADLWDGDQAGLDGITALRNGMGTRNLKYGAVYHPYINTTLAWRWDFDNITISQLASRADDGSLIQPGAFNTVSMTDLKDHAVNANPTIYGNVRVVLDRFSVRLPPAAAIAGVYTSVDNTRGVWKSPANESLTAIRSLTVDIDNSLNDVMNIDTTGKSINPIRQFSGRGNIVWGARTLAGNDNEWRYISVRRFFNMVEESVKKSTEPFVFEPNDVNTWVKVKGMIQNFLILQWRAGALVGAKPDDAFYVQVGLGSTMTAQDILEGRMNVEIGMAVVRPAEFIILKFSHKMQES
ncbi:Phage tail sheath protein FI [hydrothermal vent metagenome]|uniref:Phage tail sheath protein FI n=1 Tax=hydrothermal vent metagenome TaxID=652676 RepID=A0A3B1ASL2_9ZZZZ